MPGLSDLGRHKCSTSCPVHSKQLLWLLFCGWVILKVCHWQFSFLISVFGAYFHKRVVGFLSKGGCCWTNFFFVVFIVWCPFGVLRYFPIHSGLCIYSLLSNFSGRLGQPIIWVWLSLRCLGRVRFHRSCPLFLMYNASQGCPGSFRIPLIHIPPWPPSSEYSDPKYRGSPPSVSAVLVSSSKYS